MMQNPRLALAIVAVTASILVRPTRTQTPHPSGAPQLYGFYWVVADEPAALASSWSGGLETHTMACNRLGFVPSARAAVLAGGHAWNVTTATEITDARDLPSTSWVRVVEARYCPFLRSVFTAVAGAASPGQTLTPAQMQAAAQQLLAPDRPQGLYAQLAARIGSEAVTLEYFIRFWSGRSSPKASEFERRVVAGMGSGGAAWLLMGPTGSPESARVLHVEGEDFFSCSHYGYGSWCLSWRCS